MTLQYRPLIAHGEKSEQLTLGASGDVLGEFKYRLLLTAGMASCMFVRSTVAVIVCGGI